MSLRTVLKYLELSRKSQMEIAKNFQYRLTSCYFPTQVKEELKKIQFDKIIGLAEVLLS